MVNRPALKEAVIDTALATPLNLVLNWIFLSIFLALEWGAGATSLAMTAMFFVVAIVRKYYVRQWFEKRKKS